MKNESVLIDSYLGFGNSCYVCESMVACICLEKDEEAKTLANTRICIILVGGNVIKSDLLCEEVAEEVIREVVELFFE